MKKIYWKKLTIFKKIIFSLGWLSVLNLGFWVIMIIYNNYTQEEKFWNPKSKRVVFIFGWINFITIALSIFILLLSLFFFVGDFNLEENNLDNSEPFVQKNLYSGEVFTDLYFYDLKTNCSLSGTLEIGNFTAEIIDGKYKLFEKEYQDAKVASGSEDVSLVLYGTTSFCFGKNSNLPFYLYWISENILEYDDYTFEVEFNPRSPYYPKAMQGFIRPNEVQERLSKISTNENNTDLENIEIIFGKTYMNYASDKGLFKEQDYWQTPSDFISNKQGDCEDWAIYTTSLLRAYNSSLNCYLAVWSTHVNVICQIDKHFIILDQDKIRSNLVLDEDLIFQDNQVNARSWRNNYFEKYGLSPDERILFYLINEEEIIEFENGQEDFIAWVLERGGIKK